MRLKIFFILSLFVSSVFAAVPDTAPFKKVLIIVFENTESFRALKQPTFKTIAKMGTYLNDFHAVTHPSQPNYIAMTSGDTWGVRGDEWVSLDVSNIADLLDQKGISWKVYAERYPGNCFLYDRGKYVRKHNPFIIYKNISSDPARCAQIVNANQFDQDIKANTLPDFAYYVPDLNNDGHDTGVAYSDKYLAKRFLPLLQDPEFIKDRLVIITFDEGDGMGDKTPNKIYTVLYGSMTHPEVINDRLDFYNLMRMIEDSWGLGTLAQHDATSAAIYPSWK